MHREFHKDSKKSSFTILRIFYDLLWISKVSPDLQQIGPSRHYSLESMTLHLSPSLKSNSKTKSLMRIFEGQRRSSLFAGRRKLVGGGGVVVEHQQGRAHSHRALAWPALSWEGPATCTGGMPRRRPAMAVARRRGSGVVRHERGARHGEAEGQQRWRQSFARWRA
jgi:hypothetical protein